MKSCLAHEDVRLGIERDIFRGHFHSDCVKRSSNRFFEG